MFRPMWARFLFSNSFRDRGADIISFNVLRFIFHALTSTHQNVVCIVFSHEGTDSMRVDNCHFYRKEEAATEVGITRCFFIILSYVACSTQYMPFQGC